ncbi:MAG: segregation/condensation protein A [Candidatus Nanoarchaeia archaeon]
MEDKIFELLVNQDDITWKDIIYDLIRSEQLDPWDIDMAKLTGRYIEVVRKLEKFDFKVSGKVLLAAALLLNIKSKKLLEEDISYLDSLIAQRDGMSEEEFYDELEHAEFRDASQITDEEKMKLIPRTPQPRTRKVSIYDLVGALEKALEVKKRRIMKSIPDMDIQLPEKKRDITVSIKRVYKGILEKLTAKGHMGFSQLLPKGASKEEKIHTFIPLLHLRNDKKIDLHQPDHFGEIAIELIDQEKLR